MSKKTIFTLLASVAVAGGLSAQEAPKWVRHTALSPDGKIIAFTYKGDIFTVPTQGGRATQITSHSKFDTNPVWSPDGSKLAFASDREGSFDVYLTSRDGGAAHRLTFNSASERPVAFKDNNNVIFDANIRPAVEMGIFPFRGFSQLYTVSAEGGRPEMFSAVSMIEPSIRGEKILYTDIKGYEDPFRKHHTSSITRDIWLYDQKAGYKKLTTFKGEDRNALWVAGEDAFYYTSEEDGTLNIYKRALDGSKSTQLTTYKNHPVRYVSTDDAGNLAYSWNGELYYLPKGGKPTKVDVRVYSDNAPLDAHQLKMTNGATEMSLSPDNKEIALVVRGEIFVTSVEYNTTKRITNTAQQERDVVFSPDGRKLVYAAERNGKWDLFMTELVRKEDSGFTYARELKETRLTDDAKPSFDPKFSPDGKEIAFLRDRTSIVVLNLKTRKERVVMDVKYNYSYADGDQWFEWSPDGKWIVTDYIGIGGWNNKDVAIIKADGSGETHNLTQSGYSDGRAKFVLGGKAVAFFSDRAGYRSHGSWGAETDIYMTFLDQEAYDRYLLNKEEREILTKDKKDVKEEADSKNDSKDKNKKKQKGKKDKTEEVKETPALKFNLNGLDYRTVRMTRSSGRQSNFVMDSKGEKLYYIASFDDASNLYEVDLVAKSTKLLVPNVNMGRMTLGKDDKTLYVITSKGIQKIEGGKAKPVTYEANFEYKPAAEREYMFNHAVKQVEDKFYDVNLHGVDWKMYSDNYRSFLPYINNNHDFAELLSEILGELNASHTGARYSARNHGLVTASLGVFYDDTYKGEGVKIKEIMKGGPLDNSKTIAAPGVIITSIDGERIKANTPIEKYLNGKVGKRVLVTMRNPKKGDKEVEEYVKLMLQAQETQLLYRRWVAQREEMVKKWSDGKIAYIHIAGMDSESFRKTYKDLLGKYRHCDAVVIDTRFNGGGWLHEDLVILLTGKEYGRFTPRGRYIGSDPFAQWTKPSAVLMSEGNYSNAHGFPVVYREMGIGKLIGAPVPGTMTAVWWERQIDPSIVFGIPQVTVTDVKGTVLENNQLEPDITVYNTPEEYLRDEDTQLKTAVKELMAQTKK
ncbi:S41 family peptidase [Porphyromonas sp.]|uniref:S41 family peptidase n=1 Tax=Porphyromonas sp. TaxID=1924944 RepID=UPI0026DD70DD|nr:S41 family peptidase [Porphyromonas sp.]MDO4770300.1 S41 family peptidase [Porphyromonas sp.]